MSSEAMAAILAAVVAAVVSLVVWWLTGRRNEQLRKRDMFAQAYAAYSSYREFPYVVRRRRVDQPAEERQRISSELRAVQEKLSFFLAWTQLENTQVGQAYADLIGEARRAAGAEISRAWDAPGASADSDMKVGDIDLSSLRGAEETYMTEVARRLEWWRL
jgi:hypothetical protein